MARQILLTSFQTWLPHQRSNSSDDLLQKIQEHPPHNLELLYLRHLPVDTDQASQQVQKAIEQYQPYGVVCCGMAESRQGLTVESRACWGTTQFSTSLPLEVLIAPLAATTISHDAGKFVCEGLYFHVLEYLHRTQSSSVGLFVHVPPLTPENEAKIVQDFHHLLTRL
ncbi:peptidase C15 [Spirulina subsalsa FACHB-351]|uniref:Peptidase C15 n=1 Tax=Spirulina subsalsa FACHB-351 TaxID=234711 RepID=A0ABT3L0R8_9CYAN|nr:peptidase C15 [Spirulina subsalsa]MCW6034704.1 peptidase C15 [Spirulina subsalsa FACHB-351]